MICSSSIELLISWSQSTLQRRVSIFTPIIQVGKRPQGVVVIYFIWHRWSVSWKFLGWHVNERKQRRKKSRTEEEGKLAETKWGKNIYLCCFASAGLIYWMGICRCYCKWGHGMWLNHRARWLLVILSDWMTSWGPFSPTFLGLLWFCSWGRRSFVPHALDQDLKDLFISWLWYRLSGWLKTVDLRGSGSHVYNREQYSLCLSCIVRF